MAKTCANVYTKTENGITSNDVCLKCNNNDKFAEKSITTQENIMETSRLLEAENERLHDKLKEHENDIEKLEIIRSDLEYLARSLWFFNHTTMVCDEDKKQLVALEDIKKIFNKYIAELKGE